MKRNDISTQSVDYKTSNHMLRWGDNLLWVENLSENPWYNCHLSRFISNSLEKHEINKRRTRNWDDVTPFVVHPCKCKLVQWAILQLSNLFNMLTKFFVLLQILSLHSWLYLHKENFCKLSANEGLPDSFLGIIEPPQNKTEVAVIDAARGVHCTKHVRVYVSAQKGY